ncbi:MAG: polysaccharide biosynthesis tyrosine autokinase [Flavobacteriaceae bacterium]|nr:MAG: polysaccharide biosynthesis tyrosine autokinase [Flavobacteriaceae bacterium]
MQDNQHHIANSFDKDDSLNIRVEIEKYVSHWKWFFLGGILSLGIAFLYLRYVTPLYSASASILIKDNKKSGLSTELEAFKDLGIVGGASANNPDNEIEILKSRKIVGKVVDMLELDVNYYVTGRVIESEVYKNSSPVKIDFIEKNSRFQRKDTVINIKIINDLSYEFINLNGEVTSSHTFGEIVNNKLGIFKLLKNKSKRRFHSEVIVRISPKYRIVDRYRSRVNIYPVNKNSSVLILALEDPVKEKAEDIIDELVKQYNTDAINDKNQVSEKTKEFISHRLEKVENDLYIIDKEVKDFKTNKDFSGLTSVAQLAFESLRETNQKITEAKINLSWAEEIENVLKKESEKNEILPASLGLKDEGATSAIANYNNLVLQIKKTRRNAGERNPVLIQLENNKESLKSSLIGSLANVSNSLKNQINELNKEQSKVLDRVRAFPSKEQGFIDIARQQEIISSLYQYLLRKKEEIDISLAVTVPNAKIIDSAYGTNSSVYPNRKMIYMIALLLGLLIPFIIIYLLDLLDTKIHNKQDIESEISIPFIGDVPKSTSSKEKIVVGNNVRSGTAEAFRLIRTNLDFMLASNRKQSKTIFVTSTINGEGKSFISLNLAATLALSKKKVLLIGMDLRAPKVKEYLEIPDRKGITNYITDENLNLDELIFSVPKIKDLDIIASGVIPPNPAELLMTERVENLFTIVKEEYDIVIVDTAPVNLVTDTLLIGKYADMFMYVVRANYLDKRLLIVPQELYNKKKFPNMAIVLNDTNPRRSYGYGGYGYGGYGYGYLTVKEPWYKRIFKI